jgi:hypothetical protein
MAPITTGNHPAALWPGVRKWFGKTYDEFPVEYSKVFTTDTSEKAYEKDIEATGFGLAAVKAQGSSISYDSDAQGYTKTYNHIAYALGYIVTHEEIKDNLYEEVGTRRSKALAFSMRQTKEVVMANILNRATDSNYAGGDGKELLATDHPSLAGNWSNELATPTDLSEASLEDLLIQIGQATNSRGLRIALNGQKLVVPINLGFEAERIVKSTLQNDTPNNAINALRSMGMLPEGVFVYHYLTDTDQWFVKTSAPNGLMHIEREALAFDKDADFDTKNAKAAAYERYSGGWTDPRGIYGSPGI